MISIQTASRIHEIDFETIINSEDPGGLIRHIVMSSQDMGRDESLTCAAVAYYSHLMNLGPAKVETADVINKDAYLLAWINNCKSRTEDQNNVLAIMLAGIYQLIKWEKEL